MRSLSCRESADALAGVLTACSVTAVTMPKRSGKVCVTDASSLFLAKRNTEHGSGLGRWRWVVERTFAWLNQFRRLRVRYEKRADIHEAFLSLGCVLICWNFLSGMRMAPGFLATWGQPTRPAPGLSLRFLRAAPFAYPTAHCP